jgi:hypothetical protein
VSQQRPRQFYGRHWAFDYVSAEQAIRGRDQIINRPAPRIELTHGLEYFGELSALGVTRPPGLQGSRYRSLASQPDEGRQQGDPRVMREPTEVPQKVIGGAVHLLTLLQQRLREHQRARVPGIALLLAPD